MSCIAVVATVQPAESSFEAASGGSSPAIPQHAAPNPTLGCATAAPTASTQHAASNHLFNK